MSNLRYYVIVAGCCLLVAVFVAVMFWLAPAGSPL